MNLLLFWGSDWKTRTRSLLYSANSSSLTRPTTLNTLKLCHLSWPIFSLKIGPFSITLCESNQQLFSPEMPKYIRSLDENRKHQISPLSLPPSLPVSLCICWPCFRGAESLTSLPQLSWNKTVACTCTSQVGTKTNTIRPVATTYFLVLRCKCFQPFLSLSF